MRETGAPVNSQLIQVLSGGLSLAIDSFVLPGSNASYVYTTPGNTLTVLDVERQCQRGQLHLDARRSNRLNTSFGGR